MPIPAPYKEEGKVSEESPNPVVYAVVIHVYNTVGGYVEKSGD